MTGSGNYEIHMIFARIISFLVCAGLLLGFCEEYPLIVDMPGYKVVNWFAIPHLIVLLLSVIAVVIHAVRRQRATLMAALICIVCLLPAWYIANPHWHDGVGGPGYAWFLGVGTVSLLSTAIDLPLVFLAHKLYTRKM